MGRAWEHGGRGGAPRSGSGAATQAVAVLERRVPPAPARRHGWSRRRFLLSSAGMASGLVALQACSDEQSRSKGTDPGGRFTVPESAVTDPGEASPTVHGPPPAPTPPPITTATTAATDTTAPA